MNADAGLGPQPEVGPSSVGELAGGRFRRLLVVGPDGAGKSTLTDYLAAQIRTAGLEVTHSHWAPRARGDGRSTAAVSDPHAKAPHGLLKSLGKIGVLLGVFGWAEYVGTWRRASRTGVLLVERGWADMAVDPLRYRLDPRTAPVVEQVARLLPRFDTVLLIGGDPEVIAKRKQELDAVETARQMSRWRQLTAKVARSEVEVSTTTAEPVGEAALWSLAATGSRELRRVHGLPSRLNLQISGWGDGDLARMLYQPTTMRGRVSREVGLRLARVTRPTARTLPRGCEEALAEALPDTCRVAAIKSSSAGRWVIAAADASGRTLVGKVGWRCDQWLQHEVELLRGFDGRIGSIRIPVVSWTGFDDHWLALFTDAIPTGKRRSELTPRDIVPLLVDLARHSPRPVVHGDFAPWNIMENDQGLWVIDWETGSFDFDPSVDLVHYVVQQGARLGRHRPEMAARHLTGPAEAGDLYRDALGMTWAEYRRSLDRAFDRVIDVHPDLADYALEVKGLSS